MWVNRQKKEKIYNNKRSDWTNKQNWLERSSETKAWGMRRPHGVYKKNIPSDRKSLRSSLQHPRFSQPSPPNLQGQDQSSHCFWDSKWQLDVQQWNHTVNIISHWLSDKIVQNVCYWMLLVFQRGCYCISIFPTWKPISHETAAH